MSFQFDEFFDKKNYLLNPPQLRFLISLKKLKVQENEKFDNNFLSFSMLDYANPIVGIPKLLDQFIPWTTIGFLLRNRFTD